MSVYGFIIVVAALAILLPIAKKRLRDARRKDLRSAPFPLEWEEILAQNMPLYGFLSDALKKQLHGHIQIFLAEKDFEACGGLEMTDEIRVTIAAQACALLLNHPRNYYPRLKSILVYPGAYVARGATAIGGQYVEGKSVRLGESWTGGNVVLAWDHVKRGASDYKDGHNVVLHEFAHQLDQEDGRADGAPILEARSSYGPWARILGREYERLQKRARGGRKSVMDQYGATNPAEFFAVATETFFEKPRQLKKKRPDLYDELKSYYRIDPVDWF